MSSYTKSTTNSSMIHAYSLKYEHYKNVRDVMNYYINIANNDKSIDESTRARYLASTLKRSELKAANNVLRNKAFNLYYVVKNDIFHSSKLHREQNLYDLKLFKSMKTTSKQVEVTEETTLVVATSKAEKKSKKVAKVAEVAIDANAATTALALLEAQSDESNNELANVASV